MSEQPPNETNSPGMDPPAPEVLQPQGEDVSTDLDAPEQGAPSQALVNAVQAAKKRKTTYRPSHKATFIGLAVVGLILIVNAVIIALVMRGQVNAEDDSQREAVTISPAALEKLGVSRNQVGNLGTQLVVNPNAKFNGKVTIAGDVDVAGQLKLNGKFTAGEAAFPKLQAGDVAMEKVNINGDATASTLNLRRDLSVVGTTRLQGPVTVSQLMTVNNNLNVSGSLSVGGSLSVRSLNIGTIGVSRFQTQGSAPGVGSGAAIGSNGSVSISGNDAAGTVAANVGAGAASGVLAIIAFKNKYGNTPHVVVTAVGRSVPGLYVNRTSDGFNIATGSPLAAGGYAFDYIVMQ